MKQLPVNFRSLTPVDCWTVGDGHFKMLNDPLVGEPINMFRFAGIGRSFMIGVNRYRLCRVDCRWGLCHGFSLVLPLEPQLVSWSSGMDRRGPYSDQVFGKHQTFVLEGKSSGLVDCHS